MFILETSACMSSSVLATILFIKKLIKILSIIVPAILIVLLSIDFAKAVVSSDGDGIKKAQKLALKRIIYGIVVFFVPMIVDVSFGLLDSKDISKSCFTNASDEVVNALIQADKEKLIESEKEREELILAAKDGDAALNSKLESLRSNSNSSPSSTQSAVTQYRKSNGYIGHATSASRGRRDKKGDQTGKEVLVQKNTVNWSYIARFKDPNKAEIAAKCVEAGAANNHIGYGVNNYRSLYDEAKKVNWDLSKIKTDCNTVCSAFISVCINATGTKITKDLNGYSNSVKTHLKNTGAFNFYDYKKSDLKRGDVLVKTRVHVGMAL